MTIFYPDLSRYDRDRGVRVAPATVAVIAKATQARSLVDPAYSSWQAQAAAVGAVFGAYHWLNHGNLAAQASWCHQHVGSVPLMIDAEDVGGNTGYNGPLTVADITGFAQAYRGLGGVVHLVYLPRWYWSGRMGSPSLSPLISAGLLLVSSNYTTYSDTGPGWRPYGGMTPTAWQYTDRRPYGGATCDFNAFRGTVEQFRSLLGGGPVAISYEQFDRDRLNAILDKSNAIDATVNGIKSDTSALVAGQQVLAEQMQAAYQNLDMQPVIDAMRAARGETPATIAQLQQENGDLRAELSALRKALDNATGGTSGTGTAPQQPAG